MAAKQKDQVSQNLDLKTITTTITIRTTTLAKPAVRQTAPPTFSRKGRYGKNQASHSKVLGLAQFEFRP
jgi:hypothetical protein